MTGKKDGPIILSCWFTAKPWLLWSQWQNTRWLHWNRNLFHSSHLFFFSLNLYVGPDSTVKWSCCMLHCHLNMDLQTAKRGPGWPQEKGESPEVQITLSDYSFFATGVAGHEECGWGKGSMTGFPPWSTNPWLCFQHFLSHCISEYVRTPAAIIACMMEPARHEDQRHLLRLTWAMWTLAIVEDMAHYIYT